ASSPARTSAASSAGWPSGPGRSDRAGRDRARATRQWPRAARVLRPDRAALRVDRLRRALPSLSRCRPALRRAAGGFRPSRRAHRASPPTRRRPRGRAPRGGRRGYAGGSRRRLTDRIAGSADRLDQRLAAEPIELLTQPADVLVDDVGLRIEIVVPHVLEQHRARDEAPRVARQVFENAELAIGQLDPLATARDHPGDRVDDDVAESK